MKIAILSRNAKLYSTASLVEAGRKRGHRVRVLDPLRCYMRIEPGKFLIRYKSRQLSGVDAVIPRIGNSITFYGTAVLRQFEMMGVFTPNTSDAVLRARDKLRCMQLLAREGIGLPTTVFGDNPDDTADLLSLLGDPPHVIKLNEGAQGQGVLLAEKATASQGMIEALRGLYANFLVQEFIRESKGADIRCFVVGGKVVAAMQRQARDGEFRSNLHRGGTATPVQLSSAETDTALHAARTVGLNIAGVDLLRSKRGPLVLEVNSSPGLEGIEATTGVDVAGHIIDYLESRVRRRKAATAAKSANGAARAAKSFATAPNGRTAHATKTGKTALGRQ